MGNVILIVIQLVSLFLRNVKEHKHCPDGICEAPLQAAATLRSQVQSPRVGFGIWDIMKFLRCFPMDRVFDVIKRVGALFRDCDKCPDGDCSFLDILSCLDLKEAVDIAKEVLDIIKDSQICDGDGNEEITLGQATS